LDVLWESAIIDHRHYKLISCGVKLNNISKNHLIGKVTEMFLEWSNRKCTTFLWW